MSYKTIGEARERMRQILADGGRGVAPKLSLAPETLLAKALAEGYFQGNDEAELQWLLLACWSDELRRRRGAMGREVDDERNATADLDHCELLRLPPPDPESAAAEMTDIGPLLRCGAFRLKDCQPYRPGCDAICDPCEAGYPF